MSGILKVGGSELINDNGGSGSLQWGSGVPAGTVIQMVHPTPVSETNTLTTTYTNLHEVSITLQGGNSKILIHHGFQYYSASGAGIGLQIYKDTSSGVSTSDTLLAPTGCVDNIGPLHYYSSGSSLYQSAHYSVVDDVTGNNAGDTIYYGFFYRKRDSYNASVPDDGQQTDGYFITTLIEIIA